MLITANEIMCEIQIKPYSISPKLKIVFISYPLLFKNFTDLQQIQEIKKNFAVAKT